MIRNSQFAIRKWWGVLLAIMLLAGYWLLPIRGKVYVVPGDGSGIPWPRLALEPAGAPPGETVTALVTDVEPWTFVTLTVDGVSATALGQATRTGETWTWRWTFTAPDSPGYTLHFYHDCHTGCIERAQFILGAVKPSHGVATPTKLGVVLPNVTRDWHGRSGWAVEIAYARRAEEPFWGLDDLAARVAVHHDKGLRVLVRVDYDQAQSVPAVNDYLALTEYLEYFRRLARDARLREVYGFIVGADYNTAEANALVQDRAVTPAWYARVFNGYGEDVTHTDNVVQTIRAENPCVRVLVGPLRPWNTEQDGERTYTIDAPWLNYMNTLVALLDESARVKATAGIPLIAPDGFDVQAPGLPDAPEMADTLRADEPHADLHREAWGGARVGFGVYRDWLDIINAYPTTRGLPVYIISTNTYDREAGIPPAQNYPRGWLTAALDVIDAEPQVVALCWFLDDFPHSDQWDWFSLTQKPGRLVDAAEEFDILLRGE
ncbi:MAG TPA: hypothetical protein PLH19_02050 [Anaerolineae bacterium]|nr:hypothetical protein [Anaerolineae bacterium]HQH37305.1 hypothetical protein [Anaerolineae bacterium]